MSSPINRTFPSTVNINQQDLTSRIDKFCTPTSKGTSENPGLFLSVPENPLKYQVSIELGSPHPANKSHDNLLGGRARMRTTFALELCSVLYESLDSDTDSEYEEDLFEDQNDTVQYICIPSTSTFYHPPPKPCPFAYPFSDISFSCDALAEEGSFQTQPATLFHDSLAPTFPTCEDDEYSEDTMRTRRHEQNLLMSPMENLEDNLWGSMRSVSKVWELAAFLKPLPDVPQGIEPESDYDYDSDSELTYSDVEGASEQTAVGLQ
ncbi:hypothetical protein J3R30DRAFT_3710071 [Lentinula aciculospora]|uniref:Uncharacterized protein n=1 Tax=Lentinula aciculospora TaxID=153920 RepID=A0A9W9DHY2_9AGAR|nr:hypothetical protein J3R30DRAFT_3710071 [Lentinula aciculospora]